MYVSHAVLIEFFRDAHTMLCTPPIAAATRQNYWGIRETTCLIFAFSGRNLGAQCPLLEVLCLPWLSRWPPLLALALRLL